MVNVRTDADGVIRVGGTRVTLDTVVHAFARGATAEEIAGRYPALSVGDVQAAIDYYQDHRETIDRYLHEQEEAAAEVWREIEARPDYQAFRQLLLARLRGEPNAGEE